MPIFDSPIPSTDPVSVALNVVRGKSPISGKDKPRSQAEIDEELKKKNEAVRAKQKILGKEKEKLDAIKSETSKEVSSTVNAPETSEQKKARLDKDTLNRKVSQITDTSKKRTEQRDSLSYGSDGEPYTPYVYSTLTTPPDAGAPTPPEGFTGSQAIGMFEQKDATQPPAAAIPEKQATAMSSAADYLKSLSPASSIPTIEKGKTKPLKSSSMDTDLYGKVSVGVRGMDVDAAIDKAYKDHENAPIQRGIAKGLRNLSRRGALTSDLLREARDRASAAGVSADKFSSFLEKNRIREQNFTSSPIATSSGEATENVMAARTGLGALAAMQDPSYEIGSASPLRKKSEPIGPASWKGRRAARRLRRQGYGRAAEQTAMAAEMAKINEAPITSDATRDQSNAEDAAVARETYAQLRLREQQEREFKLRQDELERDRKRGVNGAVNK